MTSIFIIEQHNALAVVSRLLQLLKVPLNLRRNKHSRPIRAKIIFTATDDQKSMCSFTAKYLIANRDKDIERSRDKIILPAAISRKAAARR